MQHGHLQKLETAGSKAAPDPGEGTQPAHALSPGTPMSDIPPQVSWARGAPASAAPPHTPSPWEGPVCSATQRREKEEKTRSLIDMVQDILSTNL